MISYQGFSLLTANAKFLARPEMASIAARHQCSVPQIVFRFAIDVGILPLTGTTNAEHMRVDLDVLNVQLTHDEVREVESIAASD